MFSDYPWLRFMLDRLDETNSPNPNRLHRHLGWLLEQGETRQPKMICHFCNERPVSYFSIYQSYGGGISIGLHYTCCDEKRCRRELDSLAAGTPIELHEIKFSSILHLKLKADQKALAKMFRDIFGLPGRLSAEAAFDFFNL